MKIEITEAQYNALRDIIGKYEIELVLKSAETERNRVNHIESYNRGDYIEYKGGSDSKYLTKHSRYRLTASPGRNGSRVAIINDNNKRMVCKTSWFVF